MTVTAESDLCMVLDRIATTSRGRQPPRRISRSEAFALKRVVETLFDDRPPAERRRVLGRITEIVSQRKAISRGVGPAEIDTLASLTAGAIGEAARHRETGRDEEARRAVMTAVSAIGWGLRVAAVVPETGPMDVKLRRRLLYAVHVLGIPLNIIVARSFDLDAIGAPIAAGQLVASFLMVIDGVTGAALVDAAASALPRVDVVWPGRRVARLQDRFWYELEGKLSRADAWCAYVASRRSKPGAPGIAADVLDRLRELSGEKSVGAVCDELLRPARGLPSPLG